MTSGSTDLAVAHLAERVRRGEKQRKIYFFALLLLAVAVILVGLTVVYLYMGRADSRRYYNDQINMLVCAVPPGDENYDLLRERAQCPPYVRPSPLSTETETP